MTNQRGIKMITFILYMGALIRVKGKLFVDWLKNIPTLLLLHPTALLVLVLTFVILTTSCSQVQVNQRLESCNQSGEVCVHHQVKIPF